MKLSHRRWLIIGLITVVTGLALWVDIPQHPHIKIGSFERDLNVKLGLDLQGGSHLVYRADVTAIGSDEVDDAIAGVRDVVERRVNAFGVSEPIVQTNRVGDEYRVIIELAGVHDPKQAIALIGETPQLDFRREVTTEEATQQFNIDDPGSLTGPIFERTELTGKSLKRSTVTFDQLTGTPQVNLEFNGEGSDQFAKLTRENLGRRIAIYLDGVPISAPVVQSEITDGRAVISGGFTIDEARALAQRLNAGALPVPVELIGQQTIGPTLGRASITKSVTAGVVGLIAVFTWMLVFYRLPGLIAGIALLMYAILFLAIIKLIPITLTLAGITGFILSIGMAVDSSVLIFERIRENLRAGKSLNYSLEDGFADAWQSIRAANISSLITAVILYSLGTSIIRGFAVTFALGIIVSVFTAVTITHTLLHLALRIPRLQTPFLLAVPKLAEKTPVTPHT